MKLSKFNFKLDLKRKISIKIVYRLIVALLIIAMILAVFILTKILFESTSSSAKIVILKSEIAPEVFDINDFEKILKEIDQKTNPSNKTNWSEIKNIFLKNRYFTESEEIINIETFDINEFDKMDELEKISPL